MCVHHRHRRGPGLGLPAATSCSTATGRFNSAVPSHDLAVLTCGGYCCPPHCGLSACTTCRGSPRTSYTGHDGDCARP